MPKQRAIIIGAGPAGLTAAHELLERTDIEPVVLEQTDFVGGISRTIQHHGNRIDIGGHRFFSKSRRVMDWWLRMLPLQRLNESNLTIRYQNKSRDVTIADDGPDPEIEDSVMLVRSRKSRIYFNRRFFDYPLSLNARTIANLGPLRTAKIGLSYLKSSVAQISPETNLEQFLINRFGRELYLTFFKSYTEKVWGVPCDEISAEWGAQRIKGLSVSKAISSALLKPFRGGRGVSQDGIETSLIEQFLYPKFGPGQMWETCAAGIEARGGTIRFHQDVEHLRTEGDRIVEVTTIDRRSGTRETFAADYVLSTMPVQKLVRALDVDVPPAVKQVNDGLVYRDFIIVGLLLPELKIRDADRPELKYPSDNWIYIQEPDVRVGRLQIFNNWSPYMVADPSTVWLGLEYFCNKGDELWNLSDAEMTKLGIDELTKIGIIDGRRVLDSTVIRVPKTYPAYFGSYDKFPELRSWIDRYRNLFLLGRNGMHRYNNQDHSMLTAMTAVDNLAAGRLDKSNIWDVNVEQEYHEERADGESPASADAEATAN